MTFHSGPWTVTCPLLKAPSMPRPYHSASDSHIFQNHTTHLVESRRPLGAEDLLGGSLVDAVGQGELEVLGEELLDVRAADVVGLLDLDDLEDLFWGLENVAQA